MLKGGQTSFCLSKCFFKWFFGRLKLNSWYFGYFVRNLVKIHNGKFRNESFRAIQLILLLILQNSGKMLRFLIPASKLCVSGVFIYWNISDLAKTPLIWLFREAHWKPLLYNQKLWTLNSSWANWEKIYPQFWKT